MSSYFEDGEPKSASELNKDSLEKLSFFQKIDLYHNKIKDQLIVYRNWRWGLVFILGIIYLIRIYTTKGYYALTYCIGIHLLNSFIGFISPLEDPEDEILSNNDSYLPQKKTEEFRPFQRKVKEYSFWSLMFWTFMISIPMTYFEAFNVPVFWPLLLAYFVFIFFLIMGRQIKHMMKYHYLPWDSGKKSYGNNFPS